MRVKLLLALAPDGTGWVATASTGDVYRGRALDELRQGAADSLKRLHGAELQLEQEILWPEEYLSAVEAFNVARTAADLAIRERNERRRGLMLKLLKMSLGGVLRSGLREVADHLGDSEASLLADLKLPTDFLEGVKPSSASTPLPVSSELEDERQQIELCESRALALSEDANAKQTARDLLAWKIHTAPHPKTIVRPIYVGTMGEQRHRRRHDVGQQAKPDE